MDELRKIIHIDMDAFYAAIEQRDNPTLRGMPVCVGGDQHGRGVVMTCSYEARKYGIHSAMPARKAHTLCPHAIFVRPRFEAYKEASDRIMEIFHEYTDQVQPMSLDEAYLDVTDKCKNITSAKFIAEEILKRIKQEIKITASAGVSFNKFLAKVASDFKKQNGITIVSLDNADEFIDNLPIGKFYGVGKVTRKRMLELRIKTGADLKNFGLDELRKHFGVAGNYFYNCAIGVDDRPVSMTWHRKSMGHERTLRKDIDDKDEMISILTKIALRIEEHLKKQELKGRTITLRVRYRNYQKITRSITLIAPVDESEIIMENIKRLLDRTEAGEKKVRLLGIALSNFQRGDVESKLKQTLLQI